MRPPLLGRREDVGCFGLKATETDYRAAKAPQTSKENQAKKAGTLRTGPEWQLTETLNEGTGKYNKDDELDHTQSCASPPP